MRRIRTLLAAVPLAILLGTSEPPQKFDLVCSGAAVVDDRNGAFDRQDVRLRVDLAQKKWCQDPPPSYTGPIGPCAVIRDIAEVQPGVIWFQKETDEEKVRGRSHSRSVNRQTGEYLYVHDFLIIDRISRIADISQCEPAPFSGFPEVRTKF